LSIYLIAGGLLSCGVLCALSFRALGRNPWLGLLLGTALGPFGLLAAAAMYMVGRSRFPENTGTFASPQDRRRKGRGAPDGTGTFAPYHRRGKAAAARPPDEE